MGSLLALHRFFRKLLVGEVRGDSFEIMPSPVRETTGRETAGREGCPVKPRGKLLDVRHRGRYFALSHAGLGFQRGRHLLRVKRVVVSFKLHPRGAVVPGCDVSLNRFENSNDPGVAP